MSTRTTATALIATAALVLTACSSPGSSDEPAAPKHSPSKIWVAPGTLDAWQVADKLADETGIATLGNPTDDTAACSDKAAGRKPSPDDCLQLVTTDTVSIYKFWDVVVAEHWATEVRKTGNAMQRGGFVLAWNARQQNLIGEDRRLELWKALVRVFPDEV
ncbi:MULTISPECIES: hypothetical protein [unclassified Streptomyces]|uniref:hypothetical protein n=1 Tax=unclassified Streptomyces TaxID=2593676 RepID=UPI00131749FA|nr:MULTISPECIES: hypothetical protein [unclassified Streptomyces]QHC30282.1 hypothetical protein GR129_17230 [Streptomyces sp. HF10]WKE70826.1 hypothetical protein QHG49_18170 [Streptomyces sp. WP-1]